LQSPRLFIADITKAVAGVVDMAENYRLYFFDGSDHIREVREFEAPDDASAIELSEAWREGRRIELWCGARQVKVWP
jgi:hypothetical protein